MRIWGSWLPKATLTLGLLSLLAFPAFAQGNGEVEVGGRVLLRLDNSTLADKVANHIEALMLKGADPKDLRLEKSGEAVSIYWGKELILVVTKKTAEQNNSQPAALASQWLDNIRELAAIGFLKIRPGKVELPVGGNTSLEVSGLAKGPFMMSDDAGKVELYEDGERLRVVGKSVGKTKVVVQRGKAKVAIYFHVKDWAGYPPEQLTVKVTGDPAPSDMVLEAALRSLTAQSRVSPGCQLSMAKVPDSLPSVPLGQELRFSFPVKISGNDDYYPVNRDIPVVIKSIKLEPVESNLLLVSNRPEQVDKDGILLDYTFQAKEPSRLMYSHMNASPTDRNLFVNLINPSAEPAEVLVDWTFAGPSRNEVLVGHSAALRFLDRLQRRTGFVIPLPAKSTTEIASHALNRKELLSGFVNFRVLKGSAARVQVLSKLAPGTNNGAKLPELGAPFNPFKIHPHGVFAQPFFEEWLDLAAGQPPLAVTFGESPWLIDFETGLPNTGNFGVLYRWHLTLSNPQAIPVTFGCSFLPKNGAAAGSFLVNGKLFQAPFRPRNEESPVFKVTVPPRQEAGVDLVTFPEASSSYPAILNVKELPGGSIFDAPSIEALPPSSGS